MSLNSLKEKAAATGCRCFRLTWAWVVKTVKTRLQGWTRCKAQREMDGNLKRLGAEIYSLYKQGESDFSSSPLVAKQYKLVEESEARLFAVYDKIEEINGEYREKKRLVTESCGCGEVDGDN